jgi:biopolymer transport protein ExbB/TolQ
MVKFFQDGGKLMFVNLAVAVVALAVITERFYMLRFVLRVNAKSFMDAIEKLVQAGNIDRAQKLCKENGSAVVPRVVFAGLSQARSSGAAVSAAVEEALLECQPLVTKRAGLLFGIANLATLIGLVGTVFGLIDAFAAIGYAPPDQKNTLLTAGIAHAMNNTAWGLSIALVCVLFHMILGQTTKGLLEGLDLSASRLENILARRRLETRGQATVSGS